MSSDLKGLRLDIFRCASYVDASNHGISSRTHYVTLIGTLDVDGTSSGRDRRKVKLLTGDSRGPFVADEKVAPAVILVYRRMGGKRLVHVEPLEEPAGGWYASGGTFLTGDSRFSNLVGFYGAVAFHDRSE